MPLRINGLTSGSITLSAPDTGPDVSMTMTSESMILPSGIVIPFAGSSAPNGWLLCAGQNVSRTTFANLFSVIGTSYGAGDGSTTFALPDLRGRVPAGIDNMNGTDSGRIDWSNSLGTTGGSQTNVLTTANLPPHWHELPDAGGSPVGTQTPNYGSTGGVPTYNNARSHHGWITGNGVQRTTDGTQFSSSPVNNMQPTILLNYIIKA